MQPNTPTRNDSFKPKWTHFHPMARLWVQNPFDHDVVFQVADEYNRPFAYRMPAKKVSELPGGAIATLGVKHIVDELIQSDPEDNMKMWDPNVRKRHEDAIIVRLKETIGMERDAQGEVNLGVVSDELPKEEDVPTEVEEAFPGLNAVPQFDNPRESLPPQVDQGINDIVGNTLASLPDNSDTGINNAHPEEE